MISFQFLRQVMLHLLLRNSSKTKLWPFKGKGFVYLTVHKQQPPKNIYHQKCTCIDTSAK